ncbi:MAG: disulfide bond formation protein [Candidatus Nomurabacteria bacterium]|jgi:disulfide bond formation protein DsbB|nr:disulfide bond formation protein [Candidatus Nomurabacteria bacterium]
MFNTIIAIGTLILAVFLILLVVAWLTDNPLAAWIANHSSTILRIIFAGAVIGSLIYSNYFDYAPCLLCWYQRLCIFPIAILLFTADLRKNLLLQRQILLLSGAGFLIALFHNYITLFPASGIDVCGTNGVSCLNVYVNQFGFVTIPLMSAIVLLAGILITILAMRYPHDDIANA